MKTIAATTLGAVVLSAFAVTGPVSAAPLVTGPVDVIVRAEHGRPHAERNAKTAGRFKARRRFLQG